MDVEKLIEQLKKSADFEDYPVVASFAAIIEKKYLREASTTLEQLQAENDRLKEEVQQMRWIPVEERLPEEKQRVIVRCERVGTSVGWILWGRWMTDIGPHAGDVTHWMPLPAPPDAVKKMAEQRLIDANKILYHQAWESGSMEPANEGVALMSEVQAMPTIDPEALPIVRQLREELERVTAERDAVIKELNGVSSLVDDLAEFVDREIHPVVDYNLYLDLRENVDAVSMFQHEDEWRGLHKEE